MDFNLTNGTISSLTITTDKNLDSATVTGADYVIDENTITLTNLTSSLVVELTGEIPSVNKIHIGTLNTKNFYFGTLSVSKIYLGQYLIYTKGEPTDEEYFELSDGKYLYTTDGKAFEAKEQTGYTVIINFTNGVDTDKWIQTKIYSDYSMYVSQSYKQAYLSSTDEIGSVPSADGNITVTTTTGRLFICGKSQRRTLVTGSITTSNGIETLGTASGATLGAGELEGLSRVYLDGTQESFSNLLLYAFDVTANGTITINAASWYD